MRVTFMWDYHAFPLWGDGPMIRALPREFAGALQAWSDEGTARFSAELNGEELPAGWVQEWSVRGRELATAVTQLVDEVEYVNEVTGETEIIVAEAMEAGFATPEEAALSGFTAGAAPRVVAIAWVSEWEANVVVDTEPSHPMTSNVHRDLRGRWIEWSAGSGTSQ